MLKPTTIAITETNLANFGSDLEFKIKLAAAEGEPAFKNLLKSSDVHTRLWRVKKFQLEEVSGEHAPDFFRGDCYLALSTTGTRRAPVYTIYYWIGDESTIDEAGTVAYKAFELDTLLTHGGAANTVRANPNVIQYREVCGAESTSFLELFPGARILDGGYDSGFHHVEQLERRKRLLQVGREKLTEVPCEWKSLYPTGVYILDAGTVIYQWSGRDSPLNLRAPAMAAVRALDDVRGIHSTVVVLNQDETCADLDNFVRALQEGGFTAAIEGRAPTVQREPAAQHDSTHEPMVAPTYTNWVDGTFRFGARPDCICIEDLGCRCVVYVPTGAGAGPFPALCAMAYFNWAGKRPVGTMFVHGSPGV